MNRRESVAAVLRQCEWGSLKGPNDVPGMWLYLADAAIEAYEAQISDEP